MCVLCVCVCLDAIVVQAAAIEAKIKKICEAFRAKRYDLPEMDDGEGVQKLMADNYGEMQDARVVLLKVCSNHKPFARNREEREREKDGWL